MNTHVEALHTLVLNLEIIPLKMNPSHGIF